MNNSFVQKITYFIFLIIISLNLKKGLLNKIIKLDKLNIKYVKLKLDIHDDNSTPYFLVITASRFYRRDYIY